MRIYRGVTGFGLALGRVVEAADSFLQNWGIRAAFREASESRGESCQFCSTVGFRTAGDGGAIPATRC